MNDDFATYATNLIKENFNKKTWPRLMGEAGSYFWNRLPDHVDRLTRPGVRDKVNAVVGNAMSEGTNWASDALLQMGLTAADLAMAPETGGGSIIAHPITSFVANQMKDAAQSYFIDPVLYEFADKGVDLGHRIPVPKSYYGSPLQKGVQAVDKKVTNAAQYVSEKHPRNKINRAAGKAAHDLGVKHGRSNGK